MLSNLGTEIISFLQQILVIIPGLYLGVVLHEVAHGYIAYRNGDPTARNLGRLSLKSDCSYRFVWKYTFTAAFGFT